MDLLHALDEVDPAIWWRSSFPLVVVHRDHVAVGAVEFGVDVDERLDEVVTGRSSREALDRGAEVGGVDGGCLAGCETLYIAAEDGDAGAAVAAWGSGNPSCWAC